MIDYTKIIKLLIDITLILFTLGLISKIKILVAPIKVKLFIHITNFMEDTLDNYYNKNVIYEYLEKEFSLEQNENGEYNFTIKQMEKAIKKNEKNLNIDEQKYFNFVMLDGTFTVILYGTISPTL